MTDMACADHQPLVWKDVTVRAGSEVRMSYGGKQHYAKIVGGCIVESDGSKYSPSEWASKVAGNTSRNAWRDLWFKEPLSNTWVPARLLRTNTRIESVSILGATARIAPIGLQIYAADFLAAAKAIPRSVVPFAPAQPYFVCHALELALKAFLSLKGYQLDKLAGGAFGHDLENLLDEAEREGLGEFVRLGEDQTFQIRRASNYYSNKAFEYPAVLEALRCYPGMPDTNILVDIAGTLIAALREPCFNQPAGA